MISEWIFVPACCGATDFKPIVLSNGGGMQATARDFATVGLQVER